MAYSDLDLYYINEFLDGNSKLKCSLDWIFNKFGKSDEFINAICVIFPNEPEKVVTLLHYYGTGNKILNNCACDFSDFIQICYPDIPFEKIPLNLDDIEDFRKEFSIQEWDYPTEEIDYVLREDKSLDPELALVLFNEEDIRLFEVPSDKVNALNHFFNIIGFTDLKVNSDKKKMR